MRRDVDDLDVVGDHVFFETVGNGFGKAWFEIQEEFLGEAIDIEVALHFAFCGDEGGVGAIAVSKAFYVVRDLAVEEADAVGTGEADASAKIEVEDSGVLAEGGVFGEGVAVVEDDLGAVDFGEVGTGV
jgi:hypothetical protein